MARRSAQRTITLSNKGPTQRGARVVAVIGLAVLALLSGCTPAPSSRPSGGAAASPVRVAIDPFTSVSPSGSGGHQLRELGIAETLTSSDASAIELNLGMLAAAVRTTPTVWELTLKPGIQFQNGHPVDAAAVVAVLQADQKTSFQQNDMSSATLATTGALTFTVTTKIPSASIPGELADFSTYQIYDLAAVQAAGNDTASLVGKGIFTGPFEPVSLTATKLEAKTNPHYWGGPVALPGLTALLIADPQARVAAVQNGEADIATDIPSASALALRGDSRASFVTGRFAYRGALATLNQDPTSVLSDPAVRRAVALATDYQALVAGLAAAQPARSIFPSYAPFARNSQVTDLNQAKSLLDGAGWRAGSDGIREKDGKRLSFPYLWGEDALHGELGLRLQQQLKAAGIDLQVRQTQNLFDPSARPAGWGIAVVGVGLEGVGTPATFLGAFFGTGQGGNLGGIHDVQLDEIIAGISAADKQQQGQLLDQLQERVAANAYAMVLAHSTDTFVVAPAYKDFQPSGYLEYVSAGLKPSG